MPLNEQQKKAVTCPIGPTIVIAGPGSGKTRVICERIDYMVKQLNCLPQHILVVTFSKLAAEEMKARYIQQFGNTSVTFGTLHSVFYRILRRVDSRRYALEHLLMEDQKKSRLQHLLKEMETEEGEEFLDEFIKHLSLMKNQLIAPKDYEPYGISKPIFLELEQRYEAYKARHELFDFDDMLVDCYFLLKNDASLLQSISDMYAYVLVDEFQDINLVQFEILKLIVTPKHQLFVVGDDDQSIYQFRGAKPEFLLSFKSYFKEATEIYLNVNYRCSGAILGASLALIEKNKVRYQKALTTPNPMGHAPLLVHCEDARAEALDILKRIAQRRREGVALDEFAVIYRTNLQARPIVEQLIAANIPFCLREGMASLYDQWITKDIFAYLQLAENRQDTEALLRIINKPKRYISKANLELAKKESLPLIQALLGLETLSHWQKDYLQQLLYDLQLIKELPLTKKLDYIRNHIGYQEYLKEYAAYRKMPANSLFEVLDDIEESMAEYQTFSDWALALKETADLVKRTPKKREKNYLTLTTMHGAKGLEFDTVFVIDVIEGIVPYHKSEDQASLEEERRLLYVAMTRAKFNLFLYIPKYKHGKVAEMSNFIKELQIGQLKKHLKVGQNLRHKQLGKGKIIEVLEKGIIKVQFESGQKRKIDSHYCINNAIISWEGEEYEKG